MNSSGLLKTALFLLLILFGYSVAAQHKVVRAPYPQLHFHKARGILLLIPSSDGKFYLDNQFLTDLTANDSVYIINLKPVTHTVQFATFSGTSQTIIRTDKRSVYTLNLGENQLLKSYGSPDWFQSLNSIAGNKRFYDRSKCWFNLTYLTFFSRDIWEGNDFGFNSFTTIFGIRPVKAFSLGLGVSYDHYDIEATYVYSFKDVSLLPVFLDIRSHVSNRKVSPYFKLDLGHTFLLTERSYLNENWGEYSLIKGRVYGSPGFGVNIFIVNGLQLDFSVECSLWGYEYLLYYDISSATGYSHNDNTGFWKFNIGIGFQKKY